MVEFSMLSYGGMDYQFETHGTDLKDFSLYGCGCIFDTSLALALLCASLFLYFVAAMTYIKY